MSNMSRPAEARRASSRRHLFGQGAHEPYAGALLQGRGMLSLEASLARS